MTLLRSRPGLAAGLPFLLAMSGLLAAPASAQCANLWLPGQGVPGVDGVVLSTTMWDPDGAGPQSPVCVVGGTFAFVDTIQANSIATYDPSTGVWKALGSGILGPTYLSAQVQVRALAVLPSGELVAAGNFGTAGGATANHVARWNGSTWSPLGTGMNSRCGPWPCWPTAISWPVGSSRWRAASTSTASRVGMARPGRRSAPECRRRWAA